MRPSDWPDGVRLVAFTPALAEEAHRLLVHSYAKGGGTVSCFPSWWQALSQDSEYDASLLFPVIDSGGRMIAFAQCWTSAFVKDIVVDAGWRRQGLGEALLWHIIGVFIGRRASRLCLKVEVDNPSGAENLYRRLAFVPCPDD